MPPTARAQARAARDGVLCPEVLALIFERLPPVEQCVAVRRRGREWRRWAAPRAAALRPQLRQLQLQALAAYQLPLWTCAAAAEGGHLQVLQWARQQQPPCPWGKETCAAAAAENGHLHVLQWLREQQPPGP
ncbi:MAG: hypothetical protein J3K34DRAFT_520586 [Monoraphidium minutum]|nr:MAG: hypothetical protein J3K34DRAFT_520586 [Monoraphidium minutum]